MIETKSLTKAFQSKKGKKVIAVDKLNITCNDGEIYALLGPNGAGKTTTLRMLSTLIKPTGGDAIINGHSILKNKQEIRRIIGVVSYETRVYEKMTPREIGLYFGKLYGMKDKEIKDNLEYIFELLQMTDFVDDRTEDFSTGMKQKTVIMRALVTNPEILIFDEPTAGLDLLTAKNVTDYIKLLKEKGKTILFSTHILWEAEKLADKIGIIHKGNIIGEGSLNQLREQTGKNDLEDIFFSHLEENKDE